MTDKFCEGCGGRLQNHAPEQPYYTPLDLEKASVCAHCYQMTHYGQINQIQGSHTDWTLMDLRNLNAKHFIWVLDVYDLDASLSDEMVAWTKNKDIICVINKADLLPKSTNHQRLLTKIKARLKSRGFHFRKLHLLSALKKQGIDQLMHIIQTDCQREAHVIGLTGSGKSALIKALIKSIRPELNPKVTISSTAATTKDAMRHQFHDITLWDTPGLGTHHHLIAHLPSKTFKRFAPTKEIKPRIYQLNPQQTIFVSACLRLDYLEGAKTSFVLYAANQLPVHRTKLNEADAFYQKHKNGLLNMDAEFKLTTPLTGHIIKTGHNKDIVVPGLGFLTVRDPVALKVHVIGSIKPVIREALL